MEHKSNTTAITLGIVAALCCICVLVAGLLGYSYFTYNRSAPISDIPLFSVVTPTPKPEISRPDTSSNTSDTLGILKNTIVPSSNLNELACRFSGKCNIPDVVAASAAPREVGETNTFWVMDLDAKKNKQVEATLQYITPHIYFWVQNDVSYDTQEMKNLLDTFENKIYPTNREYFGSEWTPGIDGDEHIYILYSRNLGRSIAGYFSSTDLVNPLVNKFSNGHEMFLFNADNTPLGAESTYGVLAHEFQHMIHWNQDSDESAWMNEGLSELAALLNGYNPGGFDWLYITRPDLQLNDWPSDRNATSPYYGASFLFTTYFLDRFGENALKSLIKDPANGLDSVDNVLKQINAVDPATGQLISADDFFMDWAVTNLTLDASIGDGRYIYINYPTAHRGAAVETISTCPQESLTRDVHQYGVDYIAIECTGNLTLSFTGSTVTKLVPVNPYSGAYDFWSNKGDKSDMTLTHEFDFTDINAPLELGLSLC
jgi:immune inhibitor A